MISFLHFIIVVTRNLKITYMPCICGLFVFLLDSFALGFLCVE